MRALLLRSTRITIQRVSTIARDEEGWLDVSGWPDVSALPEYSDESERDPTGEAPEQE